MTEEEYLEQQKELAEELFTVADIDELEKEANVPGFKGILRKVQKRKGKKGPFYTGHMTDPKGARIRVTFFRTDIPELQGQYIKITANYEGRGLRKDVYSGKSEMTIFGDAKITTLAPSQQVEEAPIKAANTAAQTTYLSDPGPTIGMACKNASRVVSAFLRDPSMPEKTQWIYSENFPQMVNRIVNVFIAEARKQEQILGQM